MSDALVGQPGECLAEDSVPAYEAPCIETVLTPDEMEREVLFAGLAVTDNEAARF